MAAAQADERAFEVLVGRHWARLLRYAAGRVGDADAGDLCQDVLLTVWKKRHGYTAQGRFESYLFAVARRRVMRHLRWRAVRTAFALRPPEPAEYSPSPAESAEIKQDVQRLRQRLAGLPAHLQDLLALRCGAQLEYSVISDIVGLPEGTLRSRVSRCLAELAATDAQGPAP